MPADEKTLKLIREMNAQLWTEAGSGWRQAKRLGLVTHS